jgi:hypothetical protein
MDACLWNLALFWWAFRFLHIEGLQICSKEDGGGACPDHSKCCNIQSESNSIISVSSGCIPSSKIYQEGTGSCCGDGTACPGNYQCDTITSHSMQSSPSTSSSSSSSQEKPVCVLEHPHHNNDTRLYLPRYQLLSVPSNTVGQMYGFPLKKHYNTKTPAVIAYYSSHGHILTHTKQNHHAHQIRVAIIMIHGSDRNADEYLYTTMTAAHIQNKYQPNEVLSIAPRFLAREDGTASVPVVYDDNVIVEMECLQWNETYPIPHTWRYGANALHPFDDVSSYDVIDEMMEYLLSSSKNTFKSLERIVIAGHSAGGQFVHRWAMTTSKAAFGDTPILHGFHHDHTMTTMMKRNLQSSRNNSTIDIVIVPANPRSYCYLDARRFVNGTFQVPSKSMIQSCPTYNSWEWGLEDGGLPCTYRDKALAHFDGNVSQLADMYSKRNVVYLSGAKDTEHLHGSCEDDGFQGVHRRQRSALFFNSLKELFGKQVHSRMVVKDSGHDHMFMFQSDEGRYALFGETIP